jgi:hypothetical protein
MYASKRPSTTVYLTQSLLPAKAFPLALRYAPSVISQPMICKHHCENGFVIGDPSVPGVTCVSVWRRTHRGGQTEICGRVS